MGRLKTIARRTFLIGSVAVVGGVAIGYWRYKTPHKNPLLADLEDGEAALTPYVRIDAGGITVIAPRAEMGQGVSTTLAALVAEELDLALEDINVEHGPASKAYFNGVVLEEGLPGIATTNEEWLARNLRSFTHVPAKFLGLQITGGSSSIPDGYVKMRTAGAAARHALVTAAAERLGVDRDSLRTENGYVIAGDGTSLAYTELAEAAAEVDLPSEPELKDPSEWKLLGRSQQRVDVVGKSTGMAEFAVDVQLPNMLYATVRMNPRLGGAMNGHDASRAESMTGVERIIPFDDGIAVVATNTWYALQAAQAVQCDWGDAPYPASTDEMLESVRNSFDREFQDSRFRDDGDVETALIEADVVEAEYRVPFLAHATMEPMNAVAWYRDGKLDVWAGSQLPTQVYTLADEILGLDEEDVEVHVPYMGGGFGRRAEFDFIAQAIRIAEVMEGTPVKLTWSREEDMTHDFYRPAAMARFRGAVANGIPVACDLELATLSVLESQMGRIGIPMMGPDVSIVQAAWDQPYTIENYRVTGYRTPAMLPVSSWRAVGASQNGFFHECMLDELAHAAGADPVEMRVQMMNHEPSREVLMAVAEMADWGAPLPEGHGRGVAFVMSFGVPTAEIIEVADTGNGLKIVKVWAAVDVGVALDRRNLEAQVQSGVNFGLAAAMMSEVTVRDGVVEQTNFHNYNSIRINQAPPIEVRVLENGSRIRGIGEPGLPPAAPALVNAIFAATGERIRELPLSKHVRFV